MAKLMYSAIASLDGYVADVDGNFDWAAPDEEVHQAITAGLVDECHLFVTPVVVGGGTSWLPDDLRVGLELLDERRFGSGVVHLHYLVRS